MSKYPIPTDMLDDHRVQPEPNTGCWFWMGARNQRNYGIISLHGNKREKAYRFSWSLTNGPIPKGMFICHKCNNPSCVNPDHLYLGTREDNIRDTVRSGIMKTLNNGEKSYLAKLTADQVLRIRERAANEKRRGIAEDFGIAECTVSAIKTRRIWKHLP